MVFRFWWLIRLVMSRSFGVAVRKSRQARIQIVPYASHGRTECVTGLAVVAIRKTLLLIPCTPAKSPATPIASNFMSVRLQRKLRQKEFMSKETVNRDLGLGVQL